MAACPSAAAGVRKPILTGALLAGCCIFQATADAQSFDCNKAATRIEHAICDDNQLRTLDDALSHGLKAALATAPDRRQLLLADQRRWLAYRDKKCRGESALDQCLVPLYYARVAHLQAAATASAAICLKVADRHWSPTQGFSTRSPENSAQAQFQWSDDAISQLHQWANAQKPPFGISQALSDALQKLADETGTIGSLDKMPGRELYSMTLEQGSAHCLTSQFFAVEAGVARPVKSPDLLDDLPGASCGAARGFMRIDGSPALVQNRSDQTPSMSTTEVIVTWDESLSSSGCVLEFSYAPRFGRATYYKAEEACEGRLCGGLRTAARELVEAVQTAPMRTRERLRNRLTEAQRVEFDEAVQPLIRDRGEVNEEDPANITDFMPLLLPYPLGGTVYVAGVGHFKPYGETFSDWSVWFQSFTAGKLAHSARFAVGMERGELENISISTRAGP
jgi:uncharacterized protein